jgi:guanylate kinase
MLNSGPRRGILFVVSAPAGTGKTTLVEMLTQEFPAVKASVSCTTRKPRTGEVDAKHYFFLSEDEFHRRLQAGDFLEHVRLFDNYYGTSHRFIEQELQKGNHVVLTIDTQGALRLKGKVPAIFIFIAPPSIHELRRRLTDRKTESEENINSRIAWAERELQAAPQYDYQIINDNLKHAYEALRSIVIAEEHRVQRY